MEPLKFGIIGCGRIAERHAEQMQKHGVIVAVCDVKFEKAEQLVSNYGGVAYRRTEEMFTNHPEIEVVAICTPNGLHSEHTLIALDAHKHVLCEKPMALTVSDCHRMIDKANSVGRKLLIVKQNRFNPPVVALKNLLDAGQLGKVLNVQVNCFWNRTADYYKDSWKGTKLLDGGTLYTQFSHFIDLLYWMMGDVIEVKSMADNFLHQQIIEFEDSGVVCFRFKNGAIGTLNYTVNSFAQNMEGSITVFGEKGTVKVGGQYLNELDYQCIEGYVIPELPLSRPANDYGRYKGSMSNHDKVYLNLVNVLQGSEEISTSGEEGLKTVDLIERIYKEMN